jgi:hypothetical protein
MEKSKSEIYANTVCSEIPQDYLREFILIYLVGASSDMGQPFDRDTTPERVFDMITKHYSHLPLILIESAFKRGALGQYGTGRLIPRTIFGWLGEMNQYFITTHEKRDNSRDNEYKFDGLEKYPLGQAICKKIDWLNSGAISSDDWDKIPLKQVAEMIGNGNMPTLETFGIKNKLSQ